MTDPLRQIDLEELLLLLSEWMGSLVLVTGDLGGPFIGLALTAKIRAAEVLDSDDRALMLKFGEGVVIDLAPAEIIIFLGGESDREAQWIEFATKTDSSVLTLERIET